MLDARRLREVLHYDPDTGRWTWIVRKAHCVRVGSPAGCRSHANGYLIIGIDDGQYTAHRLAWLYMTGEWPASDIDHKDRDRSNCRWSNLRQASRSQNGCNSNSSQKNRKDDLPKGVSLARKCGRYQAQIRNNGKRVWPGYFDKPELAARAYQDAVLRMHGEFACS